MFIQKKSFSFFFYISLIFLFFFFLNFNNFIGSKSLFFIFHLSSFGLLLTALKKNNSAFEFFTFFFLLLSFWFKFNCILYFDSIKVTEGDFDLSISNYDDATFIIIVVFAACILSSFIKEFIVKRFIKDHKFELSVSFIFFYKKYRVFILLLFFVFLILVWSTNFYYKIYSKGLVNNHILPFVKYFYSWSLIYGLAVLSAFFIYIDFSIFKKKQIFILAFFESFFTQMNIFSRSFLLSFFAYLRGFLLLIDIKKFKFHKMIVAKSVIVILILFFLSIYLTTKLRSAQFYEYDKSAVPVTLLSTFSDIFSLSINRWVGIDALLSVSQSKNLSFKFFLSSLDENENIKAKSFYIENFFSRFDYSKFEKKNLNIVITPGIVAFLYYTGSALFVFFSIIVLVLLCSAIEILFYYFSSGNIILANIIGYALSVRFIHFGYVPLNTINFLLSFFVTFFFIFFLTKIIKK
jgi:hypothetical protein